MGMPFWRRQQARLNILPLVSLPVNVVGLPTGTYAAWLWWNSFSPFHFWLVFLSVLNIGLYCVVTSILYVNAWRRTGLVLARNRERVARRALKSAHRLSDTS